MDQKRLKIAFLSRYSGIVERGAETYVLELAKRLEAFHQVDILSGLDSDNFWKIVQGHYDIVISTNGRIQALKVSLGRLFSNYKLIISGQAGIGRDDIWNIAIACPNVFVALTDVELNWAKKWAWFSKLIKIPNGIDLKKFSSTGQKIKLDLEPPVILSVGALSWYKHHDRTIEAVSKLKKGSLLIIGQGPLKSELTKLGNEKLGKTRFKVISAPYSEIAKYYRSCDLFTLPSWDREAFGIVYLEAMASGLGVVAPDDLSRQEIIGQAGILVDTSDPEKFSQALEGAFKKDWLKVARLQAEKFSWDKVANSYLELFKDLKS